MSKKQFTSRLNDLFTSIDSSAEMAPASGLSVIVDRALTPEPMPSFVAEQSLAGWSWEVNREGSYTACGPEVLTHLGLEANAFLGQPVTAFRLDEKTSHQIEKLLLAGNFPAETDGVICDAQGRWQPIHICILSGPVGDAQSWRGLFQLIPLPSPESAILTPTVAQSSSTLPETDSQKPADQNPARKSEMTSQPNEPAIPSAGGLSSVAVNANGLTSVSMPWTSAGRASLKEKQVTVVPSQPDHPATIAVPLQTSDMGDLLLEVIDENELRTWSEEERQMVTEVASQLSLALENARLYQTAQQEITERVRAEDVILHRNRDLAALNTIGQRLTSLTSRNEIFDTLAEMVGQVLDNRNLYICMFDRAKQNLSFPVYRENGLPKTIPDQPARHGLPEYLVATRAPLLITRNLADHLNNLKVGLTGEIPASLLGIPILAGSRQVGALVVQDFSQENAPQFDEVHLELVSTAVAQAATALENASLFQQMQDALKAIENRERYQAGVARAAASLSEFGTRSLGQVLRFLGQAAQANRVYFLAYDENELTWKLVEDWTSPLVAYLFDRSKIHAIRNEVFSKLVGNLRSDGWAIPLPGGRVEGATDFFRGQNIQSALILSVTGKAGVPNLLIFEQIDRARQWNQDEVNILRVAADAIANTYVREDLLVQLRANLDETESLYNASNRLVAANDFQEMLAAVINGVKPAGINRTVMLLFENDVFNKISRITVEANWYSGHGTPPQAVGTEISRTVFEKPLQSSTQAFYEDIRESILDESMRQAFQEQNILSVANLPMWSGKRQIGVVMLFSEQRHVFTGREKRLLPPLVDQLTIAVENRHLFEQTQTALSETGLLYIMSSGVAQAVDPADMVTLVANNVLPGGAEQVSLMIANLDEEGAMTEVEIAGFIDTTGETNLEGMRFQIEDLPILQILSENGLTVSDLNDATLDLATRHTLERLQIRSASFVPLRTGGKNIGALVASSRHPANYAAADIRLFRTVANGIAVAMEKQRLLRQAQRRALELQTASEIARDTTSTLALDSLLSHMASLLVERFTFSHVSIFLVDESGQFARISESTGSAGMELKQRGYHMAVGSRSVIGTVTASGLPLVLNDVAESDLYFPNPLLPDTRAEIGLPLKLGDRVIGALDIHSQTANSFTKDDVFVLGILADQIAIAIENARAYELSQKAIEDMREVDRVKSQFLANMSHELRTPLNSIIGFSRVILKGIDGPVNDVQQQDLNAIYSSGQHLLSLINDILDLSKIEAGKMELSFSDINMADLVNSAMSTAVGLVKDKSITLVTHIPDDLPVVRADSIRVRQVLINFLSNAAKFTDEGSISVEASRIISPDGYPEILLTVTDSGPGIAETDQSKLFLPFSQVDDSPTRKTGGTGLGLSICRSLIEMHNGRIGLLSSEVGKGSTFFFTLPLPVQEVKPPDMVAGDGNVILAIDDDPQVISLYERYLRPQGYLVVPHTNPRTAIEVARNLQPFAITLDIMMPEMDGWQVIKALKNDPATCDIPVIVCSILEEEEKGYNLGAADYLVKPFVSEDLLNALNRANTSGDLHEIMLIDDDPEDLRLVQKMVEENKHFQAIPIEGGQAGWAALQDRTPDVIILDLFMPDMNGFEILAKLRASSAHRHIPVIILTGADLTPEQHKQLSEFGQNLLVKGFLREKELLNSLETALQQVHRPIRKVA
jgi:signal transduction histidine kinase/CheY-like chemotaxis protein